MSMIGLLDFREPRRTPMSDEVFLSRQSWSELSDVGARHLDAAALQFNDISLAMPVWGSGFSLLRCSVVL